MMRTFTSSLALAAMILTPACAQSNVDASDKEAIEQIVRNYILQNPEIIEEAFVALNEKERAKEAERATALIEENATALFEDPLDNSIGPADAPITVVEFFDYRCGYCKRSTDWVVSLPEKFDNKVRVVFKEMPILSPESEKAALAAVAAGNQGKYLEMHLGLMELESRSGFGPEEINAVAEAAGIDVPKMRADMASIDVQRVVSRSKSLARAINVDGTPNFIVGNTLVVGADVNRVEDLIKAALEDS